MLIRVAMIGYARAPSFELHPPNAPPMEERIAYALLKRKAFREACEKEGVDLNVARRIAGVEEEEKGEKEGMGTGELFGWMKRRGRQERQAREAKVRAKAKLESKL